MISGFIYMIRNKINGKTYIGQTTLEKVEYRWNNHIRELNNGTHHNDFLKHSWNKYGQDNFEFKVIEQVFENSLDELLNKLNTLEIHYIYFYKSMYNQHGYNLKEGGRYSKLTEYSKQKISNKNKGKIRTNEAKEKNRQSHIGKKWTKEQKENLKQVRKNMVHPQSGKKRTPEEIEKIRKSLLKDKYVEITSELEAIICNELFIQKTPMKELLIEYNITYNQLRTIKDKNKEKYIDILNKQKIIKNKQYKRKSDEQIKKSRINSNNALIKLAEKRKYSFSNEEINDIIKLRKDNISLQKIGNKYGVVKEVIKRVLIENNREDLISRRKKYQGEINIEKINQ